MIERIERLARNSRNYPPECSSLNCLNIDSAVVAVPGARAVGIVRGALPTVNGAGVTRSADSRSTDPASLHPSLRVSGPTRFGRCAP